MNPDGAPNRSIKTTDTIFGIVEIVQEGGSSTLTEVAEEMDLAPSTVHAHLSTLEDGGYLTQTNDGYQLGLKFFNHGMHARGRFEIVSTARDTIRNLSDEVGETVWLATEEQGYVYFLDRAMGDRAVATEGWVGLSTHLHAPAAGKAILAHLPDKQRDRIIERRGLPQFTQYTITDRAQLLPELESICERGIAVTDKEKNERVRGVSSPIIVDDEVKGAVSVAGPAERLVGDLFEEELPQRVKGAANAIEIDMTS